MKIRQPRRHWLRLGHEKTVCGRVIVYNVTTNRAFVSCPTCRRILQKRHSLPEGR